jgi:putative ABC transport system permease protein
MTSLLGDVRLGFRHLTRSPGFSAVAILTLALAIWANAVIFAVVDAILLKSLPFADASRLVSIAEAFPQLGFEAGTFSAADFNLYRTQQTSFEAVGAVENRDYELSGGGRPQQVTGARVTGSTFAVLGVAPLLGRTFSPEDDQARLPYAVLSHHLWVSRYGGDPAIVGKTLQLDRASYTIVGVMPPPFKFPLPGPLVNNRPADLWIPAAFAPTDLIITGGPFNFTVVGRLRPGRSLDAAAAETATLAPRIQEKYPAAFAAYSGGAQLFLRVSSYAGDVVGNVRLLLRLLSGAAALVLLIACANLGALLLSRGIRRRREMATRAALGASRFALLRQLFIEHLVLAALGGGLGAILAFAGQRSFVAWLPPNLPIPNDIEVSGRVVLFTIILTLVASLLFGIAPALLLRHKNLLSPLHETGRSPSVARGGRRLQSALIVAELAVAIVLLIAAGLLVRSFDKLAGVDPGFRASQLLALAVPLPTQAYANGAQIRTFYRQALDKIHRLPQIEQAGLASDVPLQARNTGSFALEGRRTGPNMTPPSVHYTWVLGDYGQSLGVPLVRGRWLTDDDHEGTAAVALINATMAKRFWPGEDPVGKRIRWAADRTWMTIVGVIGDVRYDGLRAAPSPHVYRPFLQESDAFIGNTLTGGLRHMMVVVRTASDPTAVAGQIEREVHTLDPELAVADIRTLDRDVHTSIARERFTAALVSVFAGLAAFLAIVGVYGVIAFTVAQQIGDIGLRMALGAQKGDVLRLVLTTSVRLTVGAAGLGLVGAWLISRSLQTLLFGISATDPLTFVGAPLALLIVALLGAGVPAWRATRVDPIQALRVE